MICNIFFFKSQLSVLVYLISDVIIFNDILCVCTNNVHKSILMINKFLTYTKNELINKFNSLSVNKRKTQEIPNKQATKDHLKN